MLSEKIINQQRNRLSGGIGIVVLLAMISLIYVQYFMPVHAHYHAGFQVYVDGSLVDFSKPEYMKEAPCVMPGKKVKEDEQLEKAHLHDGVGTVAHSHRTRAKWKDLFTNIKYSFDAKKPMVAYVNGKKVADILNHPIEPYDSVVILVGQHEEPSLYFAKAITKAQILTEETKSENCGGS